MRKFILALIAVALFAATPEPIADVSQDETGGAVIRFQSGRTVTVKLYPEQTGIRDAQFVPDRTAAGWLVESRVEGISEPLPLALVIWRPDKPLRRFSAEQALWSWSFWADGKQVAFHSGPLHGEQRAHCELHDVDTGRLIATWSGVLGSDDAPDWTGFLRD